MGKDQKIDQILQEDKRQEELPLKDAVLHDLHGLHGASIDLILCISLPIYIQFKIIEDQDWFRFYFALLLIFDLSDIP